ncbi:uncharacterized protein LOC133298775 [Gastrolobium bilobum]|uniref:uncharacterized protein LOC133298775 n=1 Tax=Gastrolobium bilobum TaxID=150636 RepID=UPI002AB318F1|nr:uncharacterized protein LOC133298775 [Gastrolobium bilobum]
MIGCVVTCFQTYAFWNPILIPLSRWRLPVLIFFVAGRRLHLRLLVIFYISGNNQKPGFLVGSYGLTWALKNSSRISKLAILNSPLTVSSVIPGLFQQLRHGSWTIATKIQGFLAMTALMNLFPSTN